MRLMITIALLGLTSDACAAPWPVLSNPQITRCGTSSCTTDVYYSNGGVYMVDIPGVGTPAGGSGGTNVIAIGVHCAEGNAMTGDLPFRRCGWEKATAHAPNNLGKCTLRGLGSWELTADSNCSVEATWGGHMGAGPGGECVVFSNSAPRGFDFNPVNTPWGWITAEQAANSGNRFCAKPLPPNVRCELRLPSVIDHGVVLVGESSKREDDGEIDCGRTPKIDVLVNGDRDTGGVRITAAPVVVNATTVRIVSEIRVSSSAVPGEHNAAYVFVASPY